MRLALLLALASIVSGGGAVEHNCDFVCDLTDCQDEHNCGHSGAGFVCDFEDGACGWMDASGQQYTWERRQREMLSDTGPNSDYSTGTSTGWFMAVTAVESEQVSTAELVSPELKQSAPTCRLSLRYFLWDSGHTGLGHAPLWASVRYRDNEEAVLWRPEASGWRGWREASVFVGRISSQFRLVLHSQRQRGQAADVAVDQLSFHDCALPAPPQVACPAGTLTCHNEACVEQRLVCDGTDDCGDGTDEDSEQCDGFHRCDFEDGLCDMWDLRSLSSLKWIRTSQNNISITDPQQGPGRDHSHNTAAGAFLYVTVPESGLKNDWAAFQSKRLDPTNSSHPCKMVMYSHQFGPRSGGLTVLVADKKVYPVWERGGALGDLWVRAEVEIVTNASFQILVMAAIRDFSYGGIGVDSIVLSPGCRRSSENWTLAEFPKSPKDPCASPEKMCDFHEDCDGAEDESRCGDFQFPEGHKGWTDSSVGSQGWLLHRNDTSNELYLFVAEAAGQQTTEAQTKTPLLGPAGPSCIVRFDYALTGHPEHIGELSLRVLDSILGPLPRLWECGEKTGTEAESWRHADVHIGLRRTRFQLAFEARLAQLHTSAQIKVKNVFFQDCNENYFPSTPTVVSCNFEEGLCGWHQDNNDNFDWTLQKGMDHTIGIGSSLVVELWNSSLRGTFGRLLSYTVRPSATDMCLSFFYKLYGPNTGTLNLKLLDGAGYELLLWSRTGAHGNQWHEAHCPVPHQLTPYKLVFEVVRSGFDGLVAVDDLSLSDDPCSFLSRRCSFEGTLCDFRSLGRVLWRHTSGLVSSWNDHTLETPLGYYMVVNSSSDVLPSGAVSVLSTPVYYGTTRTECLQFWYHMGGDSPGSLTAYMTPVKGHRVKIFSNSVNQGNEWRYAQGNISSDLVDWQLVFEVVGAGGKNTHVALDDVHISAHPCESQGSVCTLERGLCSWSNTQNIHKDRLDWELTSRETETHYPVPEADHTWGHEKGHFLVLPSSERTEAHQNAWLLSPHLPPTTGTCLKFWVYKAHSVVSELKVLRRSAGLNTELLSISHTQQTWRRFDINITSTQEYQIVLEGVKGDSGFTALDDIEVTVDLDCTGRHITESKQLDVSGIVAAVIVALLLLATLLALLVYYLRTRRRSTPPPAAHTGFSNDTYDPDLLDDHILVPQNFPTLSDSRRGSVSSGGHIAPFDFSERY